MRDRRHNETLRGRRPQICIVQPAQGWEEVEEGFQEVREGEGLEKRVSWYSAQLSLRYYRSVVRSALCRVFPSLFWAKSHYLGWLVGRLFRDLLIIIWRRAVICIHRPSASLEPHQLYSLRKIHVWCAGWSCGGSLFCTIQPWEHGMVSIVAHQGAAIRSTQMWPLCTDVHNKFLRVIWSVPFKTTPQVDRHRLHFLTYSQSLYTFWPSLKLWGWKRPKLYRRSVI